MPSLSIRKYLKGRDDDVYRDDRGWTPLHIAARKGDLKEVKRILDEGGNVNEPAYGPKSLGVTPLHLAASGGHIKVMDELLEHGANIDARTKGGCGWTPLHNAAKERKKKAIRFLIENGAFLPYDINDGRFNPPLHYCPGLELAYKIKDKLSSSEMSVFAVGDGRVLGKFRQKSPGGRRRLRLQDGSPGGGDTSPSNYGVKQPINSLL